MATVDDTRTVASPIFKLTYDGKDITRSLEPYLICLTFEDSVEGEASSLEIELENTDQLFSNGWYPDKGAKLTAEIELLDCGTFTLDEIELRGKPDTIIIKGLSNVIDKQPLKTKRSRRHAGKTLHQIANSVAAAYKLTLIGNVPNIPIGNVSQRRETDLKFLRRKAWDYGIVFTVRDTKLIFTSLSELEKRKPSVSLDKTELLSYSIKDKTSKTYKSAVVKSHNPLSRSVISGKSDIVTLTNEDGVQYTQIVNLTQIVSNMIDKLNKLYALLNQPDTPNVHEYKVSFDEYLSEINLKAPTFAEELGAKLNNIYAALSNKDNRTAQQWDVFIRNDLVIKRKSGYLNFANGDFKNKVTNIFLQVHAADRLVIHKKVENEQQAEAVADAALYRANSWQQSGSIDTRGNNLLIAGNNIELCGLGVVGSGVYNLAKVVHTVNRDNSWVCTSDVKRVAAVNKVKQRGAKLVQPNKNNEVLTLQNADSVKFTQIVPIDQSLPGGR